jgi:hypothetical protein
MTTVRVPLVACAAALGFAVTPATAQAHYYLTKRAAESDARDDVHKRYPDLSGVGSRCRPQGLSRAQPGYAYNRWVCSWTAEDDTRARCSGVIRIRGRQGAGNYYALVLSGERCVE